MGIDHHLPNSAIPFVFGTWLNIYPPEHFQEGVGIAPDVWVIGDSLTAALAIATMQN